MNKQKTGTNFTWLTIGLIGGVFVALIGSMAFDIVITERDMESALADTRTDTLAAFCADEALEAWRADGRLPGELFGPDNQEQRAALAESSTENLPGADGFETAIAEKCTALIENSDAGRA